MSAHYDGKRFHDKSAHKVNSVEQEIMRQAEEDRLDAHNAAVIQAVMQLTEDTRRRPVKELDPVLPEPPSDEVLMEYSTKQIAGMCAVVGLFTAVVWIGGWFFGVS